MFTRFSLEEFFPGGSIIGPYFRLSFWSRIISLSMAVLILAFNKYGFWLSLVFFLLFFVLLAILCSLIERRRNGKGKAKKKRDESSSLGFVVVPAILSSYVKIIDFKFKNTTRRLRVPSMLDGKNVWEIGADLCSHSPTLMSLEIDDGVQIIGAGAFNGCKELSQVLVPGSITQIGSDAFNGCEKLHEIRLSEGLIKIDEYAFYNCFNLRCVVIPRSVSFLGTNAFPKTTRLLVFPNSDGEIWARSNKYNYQRII